MNRFATHGEARPDGSAWSVALKGYFGHANLGDDALLSAGLRIVQRVWGPVRIAIVGRKAAYLDKIAPGIPVVSTEGEVDPDFLLYCGGTQFFSFEKTGDPEVRGGKRRPRLARSLRRALGDLRRSAGELADPSKRARATVAALGIGLGPFLGNPSVEEHTRRLFRKMGFVSVRDPESYRFCREWKVKGLHQHGDLCYLRGLWSHENESNHQGGICRIGIIIRDWPYTAEGAAHIEAAVRTAAELRVRGKQAVFILLTSEGDPVSRQRLSQAGESVIEWNPEKQKIGEFLAELRGFDLFITSRFHGAVFASILKRPVICIEIEPKLAFAKQLLGEAARLWVHPFSHETCLASVEELDSIYPAAVRLLDSVVSQQRALAESCVTEFAQFASGVRRDASRMRTRPAPVKAASL